MKIALCLAAALSGVLADKPVVVASDGIQRGTYYGPGGMVYVVPSAGEDKAFDGIDKPLLRKSVGIRKLFKRPANFFKSLINRFCRAIRSASWFVVSLPFKVVKLILNFVINIFKKVCGLVVALFKTVIQTIKDVFTVYTQDSDDEDLDAWSDPVTYQTPVRRVVYSQRD